VGIIQFWIRITKEPIHSVFDLERDDYMKAEETYRTEEFESPFDVLCYVQENCKFGPERRTVQGGDLLYLEPLGESLLHYEKTWQILLDVRTQQHLITRRNMTAYHPDNPLVLHGASF
jgi:hypothetical protein